MRCVLNICWLCIGFVCIEFVFVFCGCYKCHFMRCVSILCHVFSFYAMCSRILVANYNSVYKPHEVQFIVWICQKKFNYVRPVRTWDSGSLVAVYRDQATYPDTRHQSYRHLLATSEYRDIWSQRSDAMTRTISYDMSMEHAHIKWDWLQGWASWQG